MQFNTTNYGLPLNTDKTTFKSNKNVIKPENSKVSKTPRERSEEPQKVNSTLAMSYLGVKIAKPSDSANAPKPLTEEELSKMVNEDGTNRFYFDEIPVLVYLSKSFPAQVRELIDLKVDVDGKKVPRFNASDIVDLFQVYDKYKDEINELAKCRDKSGNWLFNSFAIATIAPGYNEKIAGFIDELKNVKNDDGRPIFTGKAISEILPLYESNKDEFNQLLKMKNKDGIQMFSGEEIAKILIVAKGNIDLIEEMGNIDINPISSMTGADIIKLIEIYPEHKDTIKEIIELNDDGYNLTGEDIAEIVAPYEKDSAKVKEFMNDMKKHGVDTSMGGYVGNLIDSYEKDKDVILKLVDMKHPFGSPLFNGNDVKHLKDVYSDHKDLVMKFARMKDSFGYKKYDGEDIKNLTILSLDSELKDFINKNINDIKGIKSRTSDKYLEINMGDHLIHLEKTDDNKYKKTGEEFITPGSNKAIVKFEDSEGRKTEQEYSTEGTEECQGYMETITDKDGNETITLTVPDEKNPGVLVIYKEVRDKDGKLIEDKKVGKIERFGKNGEQRIITREFESSAKVKSKQLINETPNSHFTRYEIGDKTFERSTKWTDENTAVTNAWGNKYETKYGDDNIEVTVTKKDGTTETVNIDNKQMDFKFLPLFKKLPGDILYHVGKEKTTVKGLGSIGEFQSNAFYNYVTNDFEITDNYLNDTFTFAHEFGHMLDHRIANDLFNDKKLNEIYEKELDQYRGTTTRTNESMIDYFVLKRDEEPGRRVKEVIAETTAILTGLSHNSNTLLLRAKLLQENFPETMKYIGTKLEEIMQ